MNWSPDFIRGVLQGSYNLHQKKKRMQPDVDIHCNDLLVDRHGVTTGKFSRRLPKKDIGMWVASDKLAVMEEIIDSKSRSRHGGNKDCELTLYVGDSTTDLACLVNADLGIVMGKHGGLQGTCDRAGLEIQDGFAAPVGEKKSKKLYRVQDFVELKTFLEGISGSC